MAREFRVFGPPGTGKTTYLSKQIVNAVRKEGSEGIFVCSFTKASAVELAGRNLPIPPRNIGTLHSHCYREMSRPEIAETQIEDFNRMQKRFKLGGVKGSLLDDPEAINSGTDDDALLMEYQRLRGQMVPRDLWKVSVRAFAEEWEKWKRGADLIDFTDMLEFGLEMDTAPGNPRIGFVDEAQDLNPLMLMIVRRWGEKMDTFVTAGDDDQMIYRFLGARPEAFLKPDLPPEQKLVLSQSYRVPRAVLAWANRWISQVKVREPKDYKPRDYEGEVRVARSGLTWKNPEVWFKDAERYLGAGKSVMVLASCSYMLRNIIAFLRHEGIPFHNPFKMTNGAWNPLTATNGVSSRDKLLAFLRPETELMGDQARPWRVIDVEAWSKAVKVQGSGLKSEVRKIAELYKPGSRELKIPDIFEKGAEESLPFVFGDWEERLEWFKGNLLKGARQGMAFPLRIMERKGINALLDEPQIILGTIHSVKGGQADVVYLFPDLSQAGMREWQNLGDPRESVVRQFYVGATRAKESLVLGNPASAMTVKF